ncbi:hypothetical protein Tcan_09886 [Toxocara canis]|uniref:Uncharacterized protein n=1 Tax=Toxocara canis TaxID=6265 RepID=A0A0B2VGJ7_TOXCA|nr:hypothetical protein Tcan_09886 [Toxocara canis]
MAWIRAFSNIVLFIIIVCCTTFWLLHSLYFILLYEGVPQKTVALRKAVKQLNFPALIICNRMPFSQQILRQIPLLNQDYTLRYLHEWLNPSLRTEADYTPFNMQEQIQAQQLIAQVLPHSTRKQTLSNALLPCQTIVNSCSFQGRTMTAEQCCHFMRLNVASIYGICWAFKENALRINDTGTNNEFHITFQIPRELFYTTSTPSYPGIDIYLVDDIHDQWKLAVDLLNPLKLIDKRGVRFRIHKEIESDLRQKSCGTTSTSAITADHTAFESNRTNLFACILMAVIRHCNCHPLYSEFLNIDASKMRDLSLRVNKSDVCTLDSYDNCARAFVHFASRHANDEPLPTNDNRISTDVAACRSQNHMPCSEVRYEGLIEEYNLPQDWQNSQDFFAKLTLAYDTMLVTEKLTSNDPNFYELLNFIGYNVALWFSIGHIIWSLFKMFRDYCCLRLKEGTGTAKKGTVMPLLVQPERRRESNGTPQTPQLDVESLRTESSLPAAHESTSHTSKDAHPPK